MGAAFTVRLKAVDVAVMKLLSPAYTAVTMCCPCVSAEVWSVARPLLSSVPVPRVVEPSMNVTVPVGVPPPGAIALTTAANVVAWPAVAGLGEALTVTVVLALLTVCVTTAELLPVKRPAPL